MGIVFLKCAVTARAVYTNNETFTDDILPVRLVLAGYTASGGRCLKLYLDKVNYATAKGRCSADGSHLYYYKSPAFDREPVRLLLESSGRNITYHGQKKKKKEHKVGYSISPLTSCSPAARKYMQASNGCS